MGTQDSEMMWALGLMSGTSLDGVDVGLLQTDGERVESFGPALSVPFNADVREELQSATRAAVEWNFHGPMPNRLSGAAGVVNRAHIEAVEAFAEAHPKAMQQVELIGYHGQTVLHDATRGRTLQLGEGQALADHFDVPCVFDFRSADVAAGGQGAPLVPVYHRALVVEVGLRADVAILNLGGVGNVTVVSPQLSASDTGPANGPLDDWMAAHRGADYDAGGEASLSTAPDFALLDQWLGRDFFTRDLPRSADRHDFDVLDQITDPASAPATLSAFAAMGVATTLAQMGHATGELIVCGGGRHNRAMRLMLAEELGVPVRVAEDVGWDGDAIEAQAFAYLAVRTLRGLPITFPRTTGCARPLPGGRIARPA